MLTIISYLRHGLLYYHYAYPDLPESGPGSGEYGPINHMFPLTPIELHEGWIKGKERIVAACSFETDWSKPSAPALILFDIHGRQVAADGRLRVSRRKGDLWHVKVSIDDWGEIAVIE